MGPIDAVSAGSPHTDAVCALNDAATSPQDVDVEPPLRIVSPPYARYILRAAFVGDIPKANFVVMRKQIPRRCQLGWYLSPYSYLGCATELRFFSFFRRVTFRHRTDLYAVLFRSRAPATVP